MGRSGTMAAPPTVVAWLLLLCVVVASLAIPSTAQNCGVTFSGRRFASCNSLSRLSATLHWTYHPSNGTVDIAFRAPQDSGGWVAWGINPQGRQMLGTRALVALTNSSTNRVEAFTSLVNAYAPLQRSSISMFSNLRAEYGSGAFTIYATLTLTDNQTRVNHVWQSSTVKTNDGFPGGHPTGSGVANVQSFGIVDFSNGNSSTTSSDVVPPPPPPPSSTTPLPLHRVTAATVSPSPGTGSSGSATRSSAWALRSTGPTIPPTDPSTSPSAPLRAKTAGSPGVSTPKAPG